MADQEKTVYPLKYSGRAERKKLYTKLVKEWADIENTPQRQIRKIAQDFYLLGLADAKNKVVIEHSHGLEIFLGKGTDPTLHELVTLLEAEKD